uniref:Uncharacterized protein LOC104237335 n=1 Tax=Nicotiana sylvestris TaxID=4096 RepID=A0A1U7XJH4_NICSY|nr:PREDICTED: uncharacterized protein LOC104237335 [Nicotiana sylvestris]
MWEGAEAPGFCHNRTCGWPAAGTSPQMRPWMASPGTAEAASFPQKPSRMSGCLPTEAAEGNSAEADTFPQMRWAQVRPRTADAEITEGSDLHLLRELAIFGSFPLKGWAILEFLREDVHQAFRVSDCADSI